MSPRESNPDRLSALLKGSKAIGQATEAARAFGYDQGLSTDELARLSIVIEELVANLFDHGGLVEEDEIELDLAVDADGIQVILIDRGAPFDPWSATRSAERADRGGGAGIDIIRAWARPVSYHALDGYNRLEFLLPIRWKD